MVPGCKRLVLDEPDPGCKERKRSRKAPLQCWVGPIATPPLTIDLRSNDPIILAPGVFASVEYGKLASQLDPAGMAARLLGSTTLHFQLDNLDDRGRLSGVIRSSSRKLQRGGPVTVRWNVDGEVGSNGVSVVTVGALINGVDLGLIRCDPNVVHLLACLESLIVPDRAVYNAPLIRVLIDTNDDDDAMKRTYTLYVYASRLLFYLIAFDPLKTIMEALSPATDLIDPVHVFPQYPDSFQSTPVAAADAFTLPGLLRAHENLGYGRADQPDGLRVSMQEYQLQTLRWMQDRESNLPGGLNSLFWERRQWSRDGTGDSFSYMPSTGELRLEKPALVWGGLLCEEMGLGKTLELAALILWSKQRQASATATLIVVPCPLVSQWVAEIEKYADSSILSVATHLEKTEGRCGGSCPPGKQCIGASAHLNSRIAAVAASTDIVITTYRVLHDDREALRRVHWRRIVLDEMQEVRSSTTALAAACEAIPSDFRWMVSGTPLYSDIGDLNGELHFLRLMPFCLRDSDDGFWGVRIATPWQARDRAALRLLHVLLDGIMIRHSKSQTTVSGAPIVSLPPASRRLRPVACDTSHDHMFLMKFLDGLGHADPTLLSLAKAMCISPSLINGGAGCRHRLKELDALLRAITTFSTSANHNDASAASSSNAYITTPGNITLLPADEAMAVLMRDRRAPAPGRGVEVAKGNYNTGRRYAMRTILDKTCEAVGRRLELERSREGARYNRVRAHWNMAVDAITSGYYGARCMQLGVDEGANRFTAKSRTQLDLVRAVVAAEAAAAGEPDRYQAALKALRDAAPLGWRHRQGDRIWQGRRLGLRDLPDPYVDNIVLLHAEFVAATDECRPRALLDRLNTDLTSAMAAYVNLMPCDDITPNADDSTALDFDCGGGHVVRLSVAATELVAKVKRALVPLVQSTTGYTVHAGRMHLIRDGVILDGDAAIGSGCVRLWIVPSAPRDAPARRTMPFDLSKIVEESRLEVVLAQAQLDRLAPYVKKIIWATRAGLGSDQADLVEQSGFASLAEIMEGRRPPCSICYRPVSQPTFTRCVHLACAECLCTWIRAAPVLDQAHDEEKRAPCMLCRQPFAASELIRVVVPAPDSQRPAPLSSSSSSHAAPGFVPACSLDELDQIPMPSVQVEMRDPRFPAITKQVLTRFASACGVPAAAKPSQSNISSRSPKIVALLDLLRDTAAAAKTVVFTQHRAAVSHVSTVLTEEAIGHVSIARGDVNADQYAAIGRFAIDPECRVLLLHAGIAAAGLTLTMSAHVILLEPFDVAGQEAQALNRCHRIGQDRPVLCTLLYNKGTVEERMLAYRSSEPQFGDSQSLAIPVAPDQLPMDKLRFLLGLPPID